MKHDLSAVKSIIIFDIANRWEDVASTETPTNIWNLLNTSNVTKTEMTKRCNLVWYASNLTTTLEHFFTDPPTIADDTALNTVLNQRKLKHLMAGHKIWNILTSDFLLELLGNATKFKCRE